MARHATPAPENKEVAANHEVIDAEMNAANQLAAMTMEANDAAHAMAVQIGYQGAMTVGALEDEIRFYQRRTVEAILETGKRLLVLRELFPKGNSQIGKNAEFEMRVELLGFSKSTAYRFMQAATKTAKSANLALLSTQVKSASAFLELVTHDDDVLENLAEMDDVEKMSASQLRAALRESRAEKSAVEGVVETKNKVIDRLYLEQQRIQKLPSNKLLLDLQREATTIMNDALGAVRGGLRQALMALNDVPEGAPSQAVFMAGLVGQVAADLSALREEFNLPDVSNAADAALAADVAQWAE